MFIFSKYTKKDENCVSQSALKRFKINIFTEQKFSIFKIYNIQQIIEQVQKKVNLPVSRFFKNQL
jgi:hypothetical protein